MFCHTVNAAVARNSTAAVMLSLMLHRLLSDMANSTAPAQKQTPRARRGVCLPSVRTPQSDLQPRILDGQSDITVGLRQPPHGLHLIYTGLQHHNSNWNRFARGLDRTDRCIAIDIAHLHQYADAALDQLGILHVYVH